MELFEDRNPLDTDKIRRLGADLGERYANAILLLDSGTREALGEELVLGVSELCRIARSGVNKDLLEEAEAIKIAEAAIGALQSRGDEIFEDLSERDRFVLEAGVRAAVDSILLKAADKEDQTSLTSALRVLADADKLFSSRPEEGETLLGLSLAPHGGF